MWRRGKESRVSRKIAFSARKSNFAFKLVSIHDLPVKNKSTENLGQLVVCNGQ